MCLLQFAGAILFVCFSLCRVSNLYTHFFSCNVLAWLSFSPFNSISSYSIFSARKFTKEQFQTGKMLCLQVLFVYIYDIFLRILLFRSIRLAIEFNWVECVTKFYNSRIITLDCSIKLNAQNFKVRENKCNLRNFICESKFVAIFFSFLFQAQCSNCVFYHFFFNFRFSLVKNKCGFSFLLLIVLFS